MEAVRVGDLLDRLMAMSRKPLRVVTDPARFRPLDVPEIYADARKFRAATGWEPAFSIEATLADMLDDWRRDLRPPA